MSDEVEEVEVPETPEAVETESEVAETETESQEVTQEAEPSESSTEKQQNGFQKRIDELTRQRYEAERRAQEYERLLQERQPQEPEPMKSLEDFDYDDAKYAKYLTELAETRAVAAAERRMQEKVEAERAHRVAAEFRSREEAFAKEAKDYLQVTRSESVPITKGIVDAIQGSDEGPAVLYYLGKNPEIAYNVALMDPITQARELGRIEQRLISQRERSTVTTAPEPPPKIAAKSAATAISATSPESDKLSMKEWLARRNKQVTRR